jgi:hypothetical protein
MPPNVTQLPLRLGGTSQPVPVSPRPSGADAIGTPATLPHSRTNDFRKEIIQMRCSICLSHYAGPLGICPDCLVIAFPHGSTTWMATDAKTRRTMNGEPLPGPVPAR